MLSSSFLLQQRLIFADKRMERCGEIGKRDVAASGGWGEDSDRNKVASGETTFFGYP